MQLPISDECIYANRTFMCVGHVNMQVKGVC